MSGSSQISLAEHASLAGLDLSLSQVLFTTEDRPFAPDPQLPAIEFQQGELTIAFGRPSAVVLSVWPRR
jgi:hypothetical protein